jgi:hypothetical protein
MKKEEKNHPWTVLLEKIKRLKVKKKKLEQSKTAFFFL